MSSIYRKGRDGYFYYQTYSINSETGKKDKKIFHSLGTKDRIEAEKQKSLLDQKYAEKGRRKNFYQYLNKRYKNILTVFISVIITLFISEKLFNESNHNAKNIVDDNSIEHKNLESELLNKVIELPVDSINSIVEDNRTRSLKTGVEILEISPAESITIPYYKIQRVERLSGLFEQGKLFLTVKDGSSTNALKQLCETVAKEHGEFSNIVICLYSDTEIGRELALGIDNQISKQEHIKAWLAMYTYNPVEGPYFDENPGGYLGAF